MSEIARPGRVHEITSTANPIVKDIRRLTQKRHRDETDSFLGEGLKLVLDAVEQGWHVATLIYAKNSRGMARLDALAARVVASGGDVLEVSEKVLGIIVRRDNPQAVAAVIRRRTTPLSAIAPQGEDVWVALDRVRDPGNLGTVMRTIDAVGAKGLILVGDTVDPFGLEAVRATMGSLFSVPLARCMEAEFLEWRARWPGRVIGTHLGGAVDYRAIDYRDAPQLIVMGNEQRGLTEALAKACDERAIIPQAGRADSLNLAVATGVMLFEVRRHALNVGDTTEAAS